MRCDWCSEPAVQMCRCADGKRPFCAKHANWLRRIWAGVH